MAETILGLGLVVIYMCVIVGLCILGIRAARKD